MAKRKSSKSSAGSKRGQKKACRDVTDTHTPKTSTRQPSTSSNCHEGRTEDSTAVENLHDVNIERRKTLQTSDWIPRVRPEDMPILPINPESDESSDSEAEDIGGEGDAMKRRNGRGPNTGKKYDPEIGKRWVMEMNMRGQAVGRAARILARKLGLYARMGNIFPIDITNWKKVNRSKKEDVWYLVEEQYDFSNFPKAKKFVFTSLNLKWKAWKNKLKARHYDTHNEDEERFEDRDFRVDPVQWVNLVKYWSSPEGKAMCERNKNNRAKKKYNHCSGTTSFACNEHDIFLTTNEMPTRTALWLAGYSGKSNVPKDDNTTQALARLRVQEELQASCPPTDFTEEPVTLIIGREKPGRVRGLGFGCSQKDVRSSGRHEAEMIRKVQEERDSYKKDNERLLQENGDLKKDVSTLQSQMRAVLDKIQIVVPVEENNGSC